MNQQPWVLFADQMPDEGRYLLVSHPKAGTLLQQLVRYGDWLFTSSSGSPNVRVCRIQCEAFDAWMYAPDRLAAGTQAPHVVLPRELTPQMLRAVRQHPSTQVDDADELNRRIGWLLCAWDVILAYRETLNEGGSS